MGDIADYCFDMAMGELLDPYKYHEFEPFRRTYPKRNSCNRCGATGVFWLRVNGKHVLHDKTTQSPPPIFAQQQQKDLTMNQFYDAMLDVECLGKSETAALLSIGAVFFDLHTCTLGPTFQRTIHLATAMRDGGTVDAATIMFWLGQGEKARNAVRFGGQDIRVVLADLSAWIAQTCRHEDVRPWGNSANFDLAKIGSAYDRIGVARPWHWAKERCFRTIRNWYPSVTYDPKEKGEDAHEALADAVFQVKHLFKIKNRNRANV